MVKRDLLRINQYLESHDLDPWLVPANDEEEEFGAKWIIRPNKIPAPYDLRIGRILFDGIALAADWRFIGVFHRKRFKRMKLDELLPVVPDIRLS